MTNEEAIRSFLSAIREAIRRDQVRKDIMASGESADSMTIKSGKTTGELRGARYLAQQIHGRRPGKFPPLDSIRQWIQTKGIQREGLSIDSLAFLIARKIARRGTDIFSGKRPGISLADIVAQNQQEFLGNLKDVKRAQMTSAIRLAFKQAQEALN